MQWHSVGYQHPGWTVIFPPLMYNAVNYLNVSVTSSQQVCCVVIMEPRKRHNDTTDFCPHQLVMDLLHGSYWETAVMGVSE